MPTARLSFSGRVSAANRAKVAMIGSSDCGASASKRDKAKCLRIAVPFAGAAETADAVEYRTWGAGAEPPDPKGGSAARATLPPPRDQISFRFIIAVMLSA